MEESKEKLLKAIRHYQDSLERHIKTGISEKLLHAIEKLSRLPIRVCHLEETGIGRTVNGLKKVEGKVGEKARRLVDQWKSMVKGEEDAEQEKLGKREQALPAPEIDENLENEPMDEDPDPQSLQICDEEEQTEKVTPNYKDSSSHIKPTNTSKDNYDSDDRHNKRSRSHYKDDQKLKPSHSSDQSHNNSSDSESETNPSFKKERYNSDSHEKSNKSSHKSRRHSSDSESQSDSDSGSSESEGDSSPSHKKSRKASTRNSSASSNRSSSDSDNSSEDNSSSERDSGKNKYKESHSDRKSKRDYSSESNDSNSDTEASKKLSKPKEKNGKDKERGTSKNHSKSSSESDRQSKSRDSHHDSKDKHSKSKEKPHESKDRHTKSKESKHEKSYKEKESSSKSKSKYEESEYKHKKDSKESQKSKSDSDAKKSSKSDKHKESNEHSDSKKNSKSHKDKESGRKDSNEKKREREQSTDRESKKHKGSNSKTKSHGSSSSSKSKDKESTELKKDNEHKKEKDKKVDNDKSKRDSAGSSGGSKTTKEKDKKTTSASGSKPKITPKQFPIIIDSESGASFADVLGMLEAPVFSKKKKSSSAVMTQEKTSSDRSSIGSKGDKGSKSSASTSTTNGGAGFTKDTTEVPKLLKDPGELEPLDINMTSLLPSITPNYRPLSVPLDNNQHRKMWSDDEALTRVINAKHQRTKVYSGNKVSYTKVPTLFDLCSRILQDNIDALEYTGGVPYSILKPIIEKANPDQLFQLEFHNPYLIEDSDELWLLHCQKEFRTKKREEMESWREMYLRCLDEREAKLKALTANIKQSQDVKLPVRTTKLAYLDTAVKPPRNIARKQAKNGTAVDIKRPSQTPTERLNQLAKAGEAGKVAVPNPGKAASEKSSSSSSSHSSSSHFKPKKAPLMAKTLSLLKNRFGRR